MEHRRRSVIAGGGAAVLTAVAGCTGVLSDSGPSDAAVVGEELTLAATTSTVDTGLLDDINAAFEQRYGVRVAAIPNGTGATIRTAESGDADAVLVHERGLEDEFIEQGYGLNRRDVMFNDFVVLGPEEDPADVGSYDAPEAAFEAIAATESPFLSRGDESGTYVTEREIWEESSVEPGGEWYRMLGQGMGDTLIHATHVDGYTLSVRGTFRSMQANLNLEVLLEGPVQGGPEILRNPYGVMAVNPEIHPNVAYDLAMTYIGFITGPDGQEIIGEYTVDGEQLFYPEALAEEPGFDQYVPEGW